MLTATEDERMRSEGCILKNPNTRLAEESFRIKRTVPRYPFIAEVEVAGVSSGMRLAARISDLSVRGCYIDTLNPFNVQTEVRLLIRHGDRSTELSGKVIYVHPGFGMGILFGAALAEQLKVLEDWLAELAVTSR